MSSRRSSIFRRHLGSFLLLTASVLVTPGLAFFWSPKTKYITHYDRIPMYETMYATQYVPTTEYDVIYKTKTQYVPKYITETMYETMYETKHKYNPHCPKYYEDDGPAYEHDKRPAYEPHDIGGDLDYGHVYGPPFG